MLFVPMLAQGRDFKVRNAVISYDDTEPYQVVRAIGDLKRDIALVTGLPTPDSRLLTPDSRLLTPVSFHASPSSTGVLPSGH